jgi:hypothetical protein
MSSPDGTFAKVIDTGTGTWLLGPHGETALAHHMDNGYGRRYCWSGGVLYVQGRVEDGNDNWYRWTAGTHWEGPVPLPIPEPNPNPPSTLPRLVTRGAFFALETGERHTLIDASSFMAAKKFMDGDDTLIEHLSQLRELGFNTIRVFMMCRNLFDFNPVRYPSFYDQLPEFVRFAASFGLRSNLVVFPDCALVMPDSATQRGHWLGVGGALQSVSHLCLVSLQNEADQPPNRMNTAAFEPLTGLLCSHGSNGSRQPPVRPWWHWEEYHTNETDQFWREPHNGMEFEQGAEGIVASHVPMHISENKRPDKDGVVSHFKDAAQCGVLLVAGWCFHSIPGRTSDALHGHDLECARAAVAGMLSIPLACQPGGYRHRTDLERPDAGQTGERAYQRGTDDVCIAHSLK